MLKRIFLIAFLFINGMLVAQSNYENGIVYYSNGTQLNCKIKSKNWYKNPTSFEYLSEGKSLEKVEINTIDSLKIEEHTVFVKFAYGNSIVLLKEIVNSNASLYTLIDSERKKYFYKKYNESIKELIYEEKINHDGSRTTNHGYIFQLSNEVKCGDRLISNNTLKYREDELKKYFIEFNTCSNNVIKHIDYRKPINYYLGGLIAYGSVKSDMKNSTGLPSFYNNTSFNFDNNSAFKAGLTFEINLPFNNYNWSIVNEVLYSKLSLEGKHLIRETPESNYIYTANYSNVEYLLGVRYNYNLNSKSKIVVDALFNLITFNAGENSFKVVEDYDNTTYYLDVDYGSKIVFGIGYKYRDYTLGFRFSTPKNFINGNEYYSQKNQESYVFFKYDFKLNK